MSRVQELLAKQRQLEDDLKLAMQEERDAILKDIKEKIKMFGFKTTDFKGVLATRRKRSPNGTRAVKKVAAKKTTK